MVLVYGGGPTGVIGTVIGSVSVAPERSRFVGSFPSKCPAGYITRFVLPGGLVACNGVGSLGFGVPGSLGCLGLWGVGPFGCSEVSRVPGIGCCVGCYGGLPLWR